MGQRWTLGILKLFCANNFLSIQHAFSGTRSLSLSDLTVLQQATSANVYSVSLKEIGTTDYAPTCGKRQDQATATSTVARLS